MVEAVRIKYRNQIAEHVTLVMEGHKQHRQIVAVGLFRVGHLLLEGIPGQGAEIIRHLPLSQHKHIILLGIRRNIHVTCPEKLCIQTDLHINNGHPHDIALQIFRHFQQSMPIRQHGDHAEDPGLKFPCLLHLPVDLHKHMVAVVIVQFFTSAGFGEPHLVMHIKILGRKLLPPDQPHGGFHCQLAAVGLILGGGGEPRRMIQLPFNAVKAGDNHILRHPDTLLGQHLAHGNGHGVIGADDGLRNAILQKLLGGGNGRILPEITVFQQLRVKGNAELLQRIPVHLHPCLGKGIPFESGNKRHPAAVVHLEHMTHHSGKGLLIFIEHIVAALMLLVNADDRHPSLPGLVNHLVHRLLIQNRLGQQNQSGKLLHPDYVQYALFAYLPASAAIQVSIHIKNLHSAALGFCLITDPPHQVGTGHILDLGKTDAQYRLFVFFHVGPPASLRIPQKPSPFCCAVLPRTAEQYRLSTPAPSIDSLYYQYSIPSPILQAFLCKSHEN